VNPWRVGRKLGRTLYIQIGTDAGYYDTFIGLMESPALAAEVCKAMNHWMQCDCLEDCYAHRHYNVETEMDDRGRVTTRHIPKDSAVVVAPDVDQEREADQCYEEPLKELAHSSVLPDDGGSSVVTVDGDDAVDVVPDDHGSVLAPPAQADLPVVPLDSLGDEAGTRDA
jgi:hypothetical protein